MKLRCVIPTLVCMVCAAGFASAESGPFEVPAGDLIDAVESLAKQYGVDVLYSSALLKGRKTEGLNGTLEPVDAFRALLAGTPLVLREEGRSLLITQVAGAPPPTAAQSSPDQLAQVEIEGARHESLSAMLEELNELEERFYDEYNKVNDIPDLNVYCEHLPRKCQTVVAMRLQGRTGGRVSQPRQHRRHRHALRLLQSQGAADGRLPDACSGADPTTS